MAANNDPIFSRIAAVGFSAMVTAAANDYTGAGANNVCVFTADATNGSFVQSIRLKAAGSNVASVARFFLNCPSTATNPATGSAGGANTTAANNSFMGEISLPATAANSAGATVDLDYPIGRALPPGWKIYMGLGTAVASGWNATTFGGNY